MQLDLKPHPSAPPGDPPFRLWATVDHAGAFGAMATTNIWFGVSAPLSRFAWAKGAEGRADQLWRQTCFEAFLSVRGEEAYREWNFAPSLQWAAYDFTAYREGMVPADVAEPYLRVEDNLTWFALGATVAVPAEGPWQLGLSAVIEEESGAKSFWALAHPDPDKPDFHHPDCFAARLT